ncbi:MAG: aminotransferase class III-fold pyridoxal phosphate-dependent enzyme [Tepidisphaeraceae bacterium]
MLRHVGHSVEHVNSKAHARWRLSTGGTLLDLSGGPLLDGLTEIEPPPPEVFATISGAGGIDTDRRRAIERDVTRRGGSSCAGALWTSSGSDAVELAIWAVRSAEDTNANAYVVREGSYHGNTYLTRWLSTRRGTPDPGPADATRSVLREHRHDAGDGDHGLLSALERAAPPPGAILVLESVATTGRVLWPGVTSYREILRWCRERQIRVVMDEVAAGVYRHGWFSAFDWSAADASPDAVVLSKGLTCGRHPLGCVLLSPRIAERLRGASGRLPGFTSGLSDAAAWWTERCLEIYDRLSADGTRARRADVVAAAIERLAAVTADADVEGTDTTVRIALRDGPLAGRFAAALRRDHLAVYRTRAGFSDGARDFFLVSPALDLPPATVASALASAARCLEASS